MQDFFKSNPHLDKVYTTTDGEFFYNATDAKNHAKNLKDNTVETVCNELVFEANEAEFISDDAKTMAEFEADQASKSEAKVEDTTTDEAVKETPIKEGAKKEVTKPNTVK